MYPFFRSVRVRSYERGICYRDGEPARILAGGRRHWFFDPLFRTRVEVVSTRHPLVDHPDLDLLIRSDLLQGQAEIVDLKDHQRALVWLDGRFAHVLGPGQHALWIEAGALRVEVVDARQVRLEHPELPAILAAEGAPEALETHVVPAGQVGLLYVEGAFAETLGPGTHAFWSGSARVQLFLVNTREAVLDIAGQEIMTADRVTLRLNAVVTYRVQDPRVALSEVADFKQTLYREAQLILRAVVGTRELDQLLTDKEGVAGALEQGLRQRAAQFGVAILGLGVRDVILPGEMRELLNRVTEAKKAAEAAVITRREETAAMRSQANTARLMDGNPTLMRLRELETLERVARGSKLNVFLGDGGLAERLTKVV